MPDSPVALFHVIFFSKAEQILCITCLVAITTLTFFRTPRSPTANPRKNRERSWPIDIWPHHRLSIKPRPAVAISGRGAGSVPVLALPITMCICSYCGRNRLAGANLQNDRWLNGGVMLVGVIQRRLSDQACKCLRFSSSKITFSVLGSAIEH